MSAEEPGQRIHADDQDEREQNRCNDLGDPLQRQHADQESGRDQHDDQASRQR